MFNATYAALREESPAIDALYSFYDKTLDAAQKKLRSRRYSEAAILVNEAIGQSRRFGLAKEIEAIERAIDTRFYGPDWSKMSLQDATELLKYAKTLLPSERSELFLTSPEARALLKRVSSVFGRSERFRDVYESFDAAYKQMNAAELKHIEHLKQAERDLPVSFEHKLKEAVDYQRISSAYDAMLEGGDE